MRVMRWLVAVAATVAVFGGCLWLFRFASWSWMPRATSDRWAVAAAFATVTAGAVLAAGTWWASREIPRPAGTADAGSAAAGQKQQQEREAKLRPLYMDLITVLRETNTLLFQLGATLSDPSAREQADALTQAVTDRMSRIDALNTDVEIDGSKDAREITKKLMYGVSGISGEIEAAVPFTFESIAKARGAMVVAEHALVSVARKEFGEVDDTTGPAAVNREANSVKRK